MKLIAKKMSFFFMIDGFFRKVVFLGAIARLDKGVQHVVLIYG